MMPDPLLLSLGLFVGTLVGLTGVGGGALLTPLLILVVGVRPVIAVGTDLAFAAVTKIVGAWQHTRHGTSDRKLVLYVGIGSVAGGLLGGRLVSILTTTDPTGADLLLTRVLGIALLVASSASLLRAFGISSESSTKTNPGSVVTVALGLV